MPPDNKTPVKLGKWEASQTIVKESLAVLKQDKEILWFPVFSGICSFAVFAVMALIYYYTVLGGSLEGFRSENLEQIGDVAKYGTILIYYLAAFIIVNFFQAGLMIIVQARFSGQNLNFSDGMRGARKNFFKIFIWSLISATVGVILRIISDKSKTLGKIGATVAGTAWNIMTYFSLPAIVIGNMGIGESFAESASIIRSKWGEAIIISVGAGLYFAAYIIAALMFFGFFAFVFPKIFIPMVILFILSVIIISVIYSAVSAIFKLAIYNYGKTGAIPSGFSPDLVKGALQPKT